MDTLSEEKIVLATSLLTFAKAIFSDSFHNEEEMAAFLSVYSNRSIEIRLIYNINCHAFPVLLSSRNVCQ